MHSALTNIASELDQLSAQIASSIPASQPFGIAHGNWSFPITTSEELRERVDDLARDIRTRGKDAIDPIVESRLSDYVRRLSFLRSNTVPNIWANAQVGVGALNDSLDSLERAVKPALGADTTEESKLRLARLRNQLNGLENRLQSLQPRTISLEDMVRSIEETHSAALELPSSLQEVQEAKRVIAQAQAEINVHIAKAQDAVGGAGDLLEKLRVSSLQGQEYLESCESAYSASVAKGLASAFLERSKRLSESMWLWVGSLIASLVAGVYWGGQRVDTLASAAHSTTTSASTVALDAVLALISVAAPVWFAWLATRQIGQTFRLSEDYAYKASVARSYEGYRKEAKSVNDVLVEQLLASAIRRVDEQPLRVVQQTSANSPWHDLLSSPVVGRAFDVVPDFAAQVKNLAREAMKKSDSGSNDKASQ